MRALYSIKYSYADEHLRELYSIEYSCADEHLRELVLQEWTARVGLPLVHGGEHKTQGVDVALSHLQVRFFTEELVH